MEYFIALIMLVVVTAVVVNYRHRKSDEEYQEHLETIERDRRLDLT